MATQHLEIWYGGVEDDDDDLVRVISSKMLLCIQPHLPGNLCWPHATEELPLGVWAAAEEVSLN